MTRKRKLKVRIDRIIIALVLLAAVIFGLFILISNIFSTPEEVSDPNIDIPAIVADFSDLDFYIPENIDRYIAFQIRYPELTHADIVWRVNAHLDYEFYEKIIIIEDTTQPLLIVNKYYRLPREFRPPNLVELPNGMLVTAETRTAFTAMQEAARRDNVTLSVASAFRSFDFQEQLYNSFLDRHPQEVVDTFSARPGHSEHQTGQAIDIMGANGDMLQFGGTAEHQWVIENAHRFGFIIRYQANIEQFTGFTDEPWHLRYVGVEIATSMREKGITILEEYVIRYISPRLNQRR